MIKKTLFFFSIIFLLNSHSVASQTPFESYADIVKPLVPAVVNISIYQKSSGSVRSEFFPEGQLDEFQKFFERFGQFYGLDEEEKSEELKAISAGSGFIISPEGYIVTNHHVVDRADRITVTLSNNQKFDAKLIGSDSRTDLALLKVDSKEALPFVKLGDSDASRVGDFIIAIGNPFGLGGTVTSGIISAQARDINTNSGNIIDNFIQTDAAINRGNSGGPMFNLKGEVIGINFAIASPTGGSVGIGFAVPSSSAKPIIDQLIKTGKVRHGWIGVAIQSTEDVAEGLGIKEGSGSLVSGIAPGGPAEKAGIEVGDIILKFDGKDITSNKKLPRIVAETEIGKKVPVELMSKGKTKTIYLTVSEINSANEKLADSSKEIKKTTTIYGMSLTALTSELRQRLNLNENISGVFVSDVERKSIASRHGIRKGDVINSINQQKINNIDTLNKIIDSAKKNNRKSIMILIYRAGGIVFLTMPIAE